MAFSERSSNFLNNLQGPEAYQVEFTGYQDIMDEIAAEEAAKEAARLKEALTPSWWDIGGVFSDIAADGQSRETNWWRVGAVVLGAAAAIFLPPITIAGIIKTAALHTVADHYLNEGKHADYVIQGFKGPQRADGTDTDSPERTDGTDSTEGTTSEIGGGGDVSGRSRGTLTKEGVDTVYGTNEKGEGTVTGSGGAAALKILIDVAPVVLGAAKEGVNAYQGHLKNLSDEELAEYQKQKERNVNLARSKETTLQLERLTTVFNQSQSNIKFGLREYAVNLDIRQNRLNFEAQAGRIRNEQSRIKAEKDRETVALAYENNLFKTNAEINAVGFELAKAYKDYSNDKDILSAYNEAAFLTAKQSNFKAQTVAQTAWSNAFSASAATLGGESEQDQANRRLNQSSEAVIKILEVQNQVQQKVFDAKTALGKSILGRNKDRLALESSFGEKQYNLYSSLASGVRNIETSIKQFTIANIAIDGYLSNLDRQGDLIESKLASDSNDLEKLYTLREQKAFVQNNDLARNLNENSRQAIARYETSKISGDRLHQDPIGRPLNFGGAANVIRETGSLLNDTNFSDKALIK